MFGALPVGGVAISIATWDTNGNVVLESGGAVYKLSCKTIA
jgi:hypothetical protein